MEEDQRYARHYVLQGFGRPAQEKLSRARVLVVGVGGLGCPVLQYLVAAGVGTIGIVDHDRVSMSNLQRQVLYVTDDIGSPKVQAATKRLNQLNPHVHLLPVQERLSVANVADLIQSFDVVVDCTDNFPTRYLLSDACALLDKPLVFGAIFRYEGQVTVFNVGNESGQSVTYRHLFPVPPNPMEIADCNQAGVLGVLPGTIGMLQATEVIKLIAGLGEVLAGKLLTINLLDYRTYVLQIARDQLDVGHAPATLEEMKRIDYEIFCGVGVDAKTLLSPKEFWVSRVEPDTVVIDVRELHEEPVLDGVHVRIPLADLQGSASDIRERNIILICQSGKRSDAALKLLRGIFGSSRNLLQVEGGLNRLLTE
jgi:molybdopterin/thiamine biosynthesis adenylyltransferase/rhodanese-related sulfurtransferase